MKFGEALKLFQKRNGTGKRHMRKVNVTGKVQYVLSVNVFILKYFILTHWMPFVCHTRQQHFIN